MKKVKRLGEKAFEQAAGFLRIKNGINPLDDSSVHPERYQLIEKMVADIHIDLKSIIGNQSLIKKINISHYINDNIGLPTLEDILRELEKPSLDIRQQAEELQLGDHIESIANLHKGQTLSGTVNNITNFGAFVDLGIKESGLIHISKLSSERYVGNVNDFVHLDQKVTVEVLEVDLDRKRIQLKLID